MLKRMTVRAWVLWSAVVIWMGVIYWFSSQTAEESAALSAAFKRLVFSLFPSSILPPDDVLPGGTTVVGLLRKVAHYFNFSVLGVLTAAATDTVSRGKCIRLAVPFFISGVYACLDEWHQYFVPGRGPLVRDVVIDIFGAICGIAVLLLILYLVRRRKRKENV